MLAPRPHLTPAPHPGRDASQDIAMTPAKTARNYRVAVGNISLWSASTHVPLTPATIGAGWINEIPAGGASNRRYRRCLALQSQISAEPLRNTFMPFRRKRKTTSLVVKVAELAFAVPQVVAHRVARMAVAGPALSQRDRKEFKRMSAEKTEAFSESWNAMTMQAFRANQALAASIFRSFWSPSLRLSLIHI